MPFVGQPYHKNKSSSSSSSSAASSSQNISETNKEEILRDRNISPELRQKIINDLRLNEANYSLIW